MVSGSGKEKGSIGVEPAQRPGGVFPSRYVACMLETICPVYSYVAGCLFGIDQDRRKMHAGFAQLWK